MRNLPPKIGNKKYISAIESFFETNHKRNAVLFPTFNRNGDVLIGVYFHSLAEINHLAAFVVGENPDLEFFDTRKQYIIKSHRVWSPKYPLDGDDREPIQEGRLYWRHHGVFTQSSVDAYYNVDGDEIAISFYGYVITTDQGSYFNDPNGLSIIKINQWPTEEEIVAAKNDI